MNVLSEMLILALAVSVALVSANNRLPGDFYPGDKPIWPVPKECPAVDSPDYTVHLPHENDCTKFYKCLAGSKILMECPLADAVGNKLHFNPILQVCDWPARAMCEDDAWTTWKPPKRDILCEGKQNGEKITNLASCGSYYVCNDGQSKLEQCEQGLQFYLAKQSCDIPDGTCWIRNPACPQTDTRFIPHECCNKVYVCKNGVLDTTDCVKGDHWNSRLQACTPAEQAGCKTNKIC